MANTRAVNSETLFAWKNKQEFTFVHIFMAFFKTSTSSYRLSDAHSERGFQNSSGKICTQQSLHVCSSVSENQTGDISTLDGTSLKLVDKFTYLGSSVSSTKKDIDTRLTKAWTAIDRLSIIWKSDLTDKMKRSFFQAAVVSILLYGCTTWTLTKRL